VWLKNKINSILNTGVTNKTSSQDEIRIKLTNHIVFTGIVLSTLNTILNTFLQEWPDVIAGVIIISFLLIIFLLIVKGFYKTASISLFVISISIFTILKVLYGAQLKLEPIYTVFLLSSIIAFETNKMKLFSLVFVITAYFIGTFADPAYAIYANKISTFANVNYFMFSVLLMYWIINTLMNIHQQQSTQLRKQAKSLKKVVNSTAHDLKTPVHNVINFSQLIGRKIDVTNSTTELKKCFNILNQSANDIEIRIQDLQNQVTEPEFDFIK